MSHSEAKSNQFRCPKHMSAEAKAEWRRIVKLYDEMEGMSLNELDTNVLEIYCDSMVTYRKAMAKVRETAEVYVSRNDQNKPRKNPWLTVANEAAAQVKRYGEILLLDPASRAKAGIETVAEETKELMRFINNKN